MQIDIFGNTDYVTPSELARAVRKSEVFLWRERQAGRGPAYLRVGRSIRYPRAAAEAWIASCVRLPTAGVAA